MGRNPLAEDSTFCTEIENVGNVFLFQQCPAGSHDVTNPFATDHKQLPVRSEDHNNVLYTLLLWPNKQNKDGRIIQNYVAYQLNANSLKCTVVRIREAIAYVYSLNNHLLKQVDKLKHLKDPLNMLNI